VILASFRPVWAAAVFLALSSPATLSAQTQPTQPTTLAVLEAASFSLPEAPEPQTTPATPPEPAAATPPVAVTPAKQSPDLPPCPAADPPAPTSTSSSSVSPADASAATAAANCAPVKPDAASATDSKYQQHVEAERELQAEEKQRLLGVMPQFQVVMGGSAVPLTAGEKFRLALHSAIDPFYIGWALVIGGGYGELTDSSSQDGYGWGAQGYFKRVASNYADNVNGAIIGNALLPSILHQDPRYFRKGTGTIKSRFIYAALSTVICHGDNGKNQFNMSNVLGNYISGAISNAYYPANQRGIGLTLENGTSVTLFGALGGQLLEFGPDLSRLIMKRHHPKTAPAVGTVAP
jgi:hypothetical protein